MEVTLAKKEDDREEEVIVNKTTKLGNKQYLIQSRNIKNNRLTVEAETEVQRRIENKQGKVTTYVQNMHMDRNVNMIKPVNLYIKESTKYKQ